MSNNLELTRASDQPKKLPKTRKCRICRQEYRPWRAMQVTCDDHECMHAYAMSTVEKAARKRNSAEKLQKKAERNEIKARKEKIKTRGEWIADTQVIFNQFIRLRDQLAGHPCISSGKTLDWSGNNVDAGHYRSRGSAPHLRFHEDNCHAQAKQENRYASGNAIDYRIGLIARIGLARVEALEADQTPRKWSIDELKAIKAHYRAKLRELKGKE